MISPKFIPTLPPRLTHLIEFSRRKTVSLPYAFALSLCCHVVGLLLLAFLANIFYQPATTFEPVLFELLLLSERGEMSEAQAQQPERPQPDATAAEQNHFKAPHNAVSRPTYSSPPPETSSWEETSSAFAPDNLTPNPDAHNSFVAAPPLDLDIDVVPRQPQKLLPVMAPATLPMSARERSRLEKIVHKLAAKFALRDSSIEFTDKGTTYIARMRHLPAQSATTLDEIDLEISRKENGSDLTTDIRLRRLAFSHFAQFVDYWNPRVAVHADELDGRFHSNTSFTVSSNSRTQPKFRGKVTTAGFEIKSGDARPFLDEAAIFLAGLETGVQTIRVPKNVNQIAAAPDSLRQVFEEETWITFERAGAFSWHSASAPDNTPRRKLPRAPFFIIGQEKARLHVQGVINGVVLVCAENKIIIDDDLIYAASQETLAQADDYLSLVSQGDIEIAPPAITGPGDLTIHAAIFAKGEFRVTQYSRGDGKATLHLLGSLSAGSLSATEPRYATHIVFDKRFERRRPPHFPVTDKYEIVNWEEAWQIGVTKAPALGNEISASEEK